MHPTRLWRLICYPSGNMRKASCSVGLLPLTRYRSLSQISSNALRSSGFWFSGTASTRQRQFHTCSHLDNITSCFSRLSGSQCLMGFQDNGQRDQPLIHQQRKKTPSCKHLHTFSVVNATYTISANHKSSHLTIQSSDNRMDIPYIWLRDHCRSSRYYNHDTSQKNADPDLLRKDLTPVNAELSEGNKGIQIQWQDGHVTEYTFDFLVENFYPGRFCTQGRKLWNKSLAAENLPIVSYRDHMTKESGLKQTLSNLVKYGFALVNKAPVNMGSTQEAVERVSFILETMFGRMWSFSANAARSDTAYSTQQLGAHTDTTYLTTPAGIQVFHCLEHTGSGGETLLVDGFHAADLLRSTDEVAFEILRKTVVPHEYKEEARAVLQGYHTYSLGTVITTHPASGELLHLRFNPYDRAPLNTVPPEDMVRFYESYDKLARIIANKENEFWIKLVPGTILFIDNWRVLHGRAAFDGNRVMCGCYLPRDYWISKAKQLGVL